jgi:hypothetical protein
MTTKSQAYKNIRTDLDEDEAREFKVWCTMNDTFASKVISEYIRKLIKKAGKSSTIAQVEDTGK